MVGWLDAWGAGCVAGGVGEVVVVVVVVYFYVCCACESACARWSRCGLVEKEVCCVVSVCCVGVE